MLLAAGLAYTLYPNGFEYISPCTGTKTCSHLYNAKLQLANCFWFDRKGMTKEQKEFMVDRRKVRTLEEVKDYQKRFEGGNSFDVEDKLEIFLKTPTIGEHIDSGYD